MNGAALLRSGLRLGPNPEDPRIALMSRRTKSGKVADPGRAEGFLNQLGWNPLEPSAECVEWTNRVEFPPQFDQADRVGVHRKLIHYELVRRQMQSRKTGDTSFDAASLCAATLHALRVDGVVLGGLTTSEYQGWLARLNKWEDGTLAPSLVELNRMESLADAEARLDLVEPGLTYSRLLYALDLVEWEQNRRALAVAVKLSELRGVQAKEARQHVRQDLASLQPTDDDVGGFVRMVTTEEPDRNLFHVHRRTGRFVLGAEEARDAVDHLSDPVQGVRGPRSETPEEDPAVLADAADEPARSAEERDLAQEARAYLQELRDTEADDAVLAAVMDNFQRIAEEGSAAVARDIGADEQAVRRRAAKVREMLLKRLGA